jgi:membrane associated rhomboid family serine protease
MSEKEMRVQLYLPSPKKLFTPLVTAIIILIIIGYAMVNHLQDFTIRNLALNRFTFFPFRLWQIITYSFINTCPWNIVFDGIVILFVGSSIEREWGTRSLLVFWLVVCIVCGIIWLLVNFFGGWGYIGLGSGACAYGLIASFGLLFRRKKFLTIFWTIEAQHLALLLIGIGLVIGIANPISWIWVGGALVAYIYIKFLWSDTSGGIRRRKPQAQGRPSGFVDID